MKTSELRIGNYVDSDGSILTIQAHHFINIENSCAKPIPLTEEWLLGFGFIKSEKINEFRIGKFRICDTISVGLAWVDTDLDFIPIKYVHNLQNLYFALTGEELIII